MLKPVLLTCTNDDSELYKQKTLMINNDLGKNTNNYFEH